MKENNSNSWHLSKSVPISIIVGFIMQFAGFVWTAGQMAEQIESNARSIQQIEVRLESVRAQTQTQAVQLGRIEENISATRRAIEKLERYFDGGN